MRSRKRVYTSTDEIRCTYFDDWLTKLERRAFGWEVSESTEYGDDQVDMEFDYDTGKGRISRKKTFQHYMHFTRDYPYSSNIFFNLFDWLSRVISSIRRGLVQVILGISFMAGIAGVIDSLMNGKISIILVIVLIVNFCLFVPSLILALLGFATRKIFHIGD